MNSIRLRWNSSSRRLRSIPGRWRGAARAYITRTDAPISAAKLLEEIGEKADVALLRSVARRQGRRVGGAADLGRELSRRVADRVYVEDQGRVHLRIGQRTVPGSEIRRKVLGLLCFLLTRPGFSGTRDQVLDAMWPDLEPVVALNSLESDPVLPTTRLRGGLQGGPLAWLRSPRLGGDLARCVTSLPVGARTAANFYGRSARHPHQTKSTVS